MRKNMANVLIAQERRNPELYKDFIQMIHDEGQSERWWAYSIQFLAETRKYAGNQKAIDGELTTIAKGDGLLASQAQMILSTLERRGEIELSENFSELQAAILRKGLEERARDILESSVNRYEVGNERVIRGSASHTMA